MLLDELRRYRPELLERPRLVVGSKADVAGSRRSSTGCACAASARRPRRIRGELATLIEARAGPRAKSSPTWCSGPEEQGFSVVREGAKEWRVSGSSGGARSRARRPHESWRWRTSNKGCSAWAWNALARAGATDGDVVRIGDHELVYEEPA